MSWPHKKFLFWKFLMTPLHVICGLAPPQSKILVMPMYSGPPRGGGAGGTMTLGPMDFRGPWASGRPLASTGQSKWHWEISTWSRKVFFFLFGDHLISTGQTVRISVKTFFFQITSFFGPNCSIFSVYFGVHKTGNPSYLSWPRAHFWSPAALYVLNASWTNYEVYTHTAAAAVTLRLEMQTARGDKIQIMKQK